MITVSNLLKHLLVQNLLDLHFTPRKSLKDSTKNFNLQQLDS